MLRRKLIAIVVLVLGLGITSVHAQDNVQAQDKLGNFEIQMVKKKPTTKAIQPGNSGGTVTNQRTTKSSLKTRKPAPKSYKLLFFSENGVISTSSASSATGSSSRTKRPQKRNSQIIGGAGGAGSLAIKGGNESKTRKPRAAKTSVQPDRTRTTVRKP